MTASKREGLVSGDTQPQAQVEADFAQAFKDLARGERQASQMENQLDSLEKKIDELLAQAERQHNPHDQRSSSPGPEPVAGAEGKQL